MWVGGDLSLKRREGLLELHNAAAHFGYRFVKLKTVCLEGPKRALDVIAIEIRLRLLAWFLSRKFLQ